MFVHVTALLIGSRFLFILMENLNIDASAIYLCFKLGLDIYLRSYKPIFITNHFLKSSELAVSLRERLSLPKNSRLANSCKRLDIKSTFHGIRLKIPSKYCMTPPLSTFANVALQFVSITTQKLVTI